MTIALLCGAGLGLGVFCIIRGTIPVRIPLAIALKRLHGIEDQSASTDAAFSRWLGRQGPSVETTKDGLASRIGRPVARQLITLPLLSRRVRSDLAILGRLPERQLAEKVTLGMTGLLLVPAFAGLLALAGTTLSWTLPIWAAVILGVGGFLLPDLGIRAEANKRRADFRHALGSFLDLVGISLSGGAGVEGALSEASAVGQGLAVPLPAPGSRRGSACCERHHGDLSVAWAKTSASKSSVSWRPLSH